MKFGKSLFVLSAAFFGCLGVGAAEVSRQDATRAAKAWIARGGSLGARLGKSIDRADTISTAGGGRYYAVKTAGAGTVFVSADTRLEPVLAFTSSDFDFSRMDAASPLAALLSRRVDGCSARLKVKRAGMAAAPGATPASKWAKLLAAADEEEKALDSAVKRPAMDSGTGMDTIGDVRVAPLVTTSWGQDGDWYGNLVFNYYIPNHSPCGCGATALGQIMRYHRYPTASVQPFTRKCAVDGIQMDRTSIGGYFDWDAMVEDPRRSEATEAEREAIGHLIYDCGVAMQMNWRGDGGASFTCLAARALRDDFGYGSAVALSMPSGKTIPREWYDRVIIANFDAGYPVIIGSNAHIFIGDGYGFNDGTRYLHLNMGWNGQGDVWYSNDSIITEYSDADFSDFEDVIYNIIPDGSAASTVVAGEVRQGLGLSVGDAEVTFTPVGSSVPAAVVRTSAAGTYGAVVTAGTYMVTAECRKFSGGTGPVTVAAPTVHDQDFQGYVGNKVCTLKGRYFCSEARYLGNADGVDIVLDTDWSDCWTLSFDNNAPGTVYGRHATLMNQPDSSFTIYRTSGNIAVPDVGTHEQPCRIGWILEGWNTKPDGSGDGFTGGSMSYTPGRWGESSGTNIVLYAQWKKSAWTVFPEFGEGGDRWEINVKGDDYAEFRGLYTNSTGVTSIELPTEYGGRTIRSMGSPDWRDNSVHELEEIIVPEGYTNLADEAFNQFSALRRLELPDSLRMIPNFCCYFATNLTELVLGNAVTGIGEYAFCHCPIGKVDLPDTVRYLARNCLYGAKRIRAFGGVPQDSCAGNFCNPTGLECFEYPATDTTWPAWFASSSAKGRLHAFVGPVAAPGLSDAYFWTSGEGKVNFAYADSELAAVVDLPAGTFSWGGSNWEITGFEPDAFAGTGVNTVRYSIAEVGKWEGIAAPDGIALRPYGDYGTVHFNANGGTFARDVQYFGVGETRPLPAIVPVKAGCKFLGWMCSGVTYQAGDDFTGPSAAGGTANLVAQWKEMGNYTLRFDLNGAQLTPPADMQVAVEGVVYLPETVYDRAGFAFDGWTNSVGTVYAPGEEFTSDTGKGGTVWLYAKWTPKGSAGQKYVDAAGVVWTYSTDRYGAVTINSVTITNGVTSITTPEYVKGTRVSSVESDARPVYGGGVWWKVSVGGGTARLTGWCTSKDTLPAKITMPDSVTVDGTAYPVTVLGDSLFYCNDNIRQVSLPKGLRKIEQYAFYCCGYLEPVTFPAGLDVNEIGYSAFFNRGQNLDGRFQDGGFCYADTAKTFLAGVDPDMTGTMKVPNTVKALGTTAFAGCSASEVVIPAGVTDLRNSNAVFSGCHNLTGVVFKSSRLIAGTMFWGGCEKVRSVWIPGAVERFGTGTCSDGQDSGEVTDVYVSGKAPDWNLHDYFTSLERIHYSPRYAEDWAEYVGTYSTFEYVTDMPSYVTAVVGEACEFDLVEDLDLVVDADYAAGDKVSVRLEPLPKGLKLAANPVYRDPNAKPKVIVGYKYLLSGVPSEEVDYGSAPLFARVTVTRGKEKSETLRRVPLEIIADVTREFALGDDLTGENAIAVAENVTAVSGQPASLKLAVKDGAGYRAHTVYGTVTKAGLFPVKVTTSGKDENGKAVKNVKTEYWRVTADNPGLGAGNITWSGSQVGYDAGEMTVSLLQGVKVDFEADLSGLVTAGKNAAKITFKDLPGGLSYKNGRISGTPSKAEAKVVSVTVVQNGLSVVKRFAMVVGTRSLEVEFVGNGTGKVTGAGNYGAGKKVALKAAADKGSVFAGWYRDAGCTMRMDGFDGYPDWRNPSVNYMTTDQNAKFYARFEPAAADSAIAVSANGTPISEDPGCYTGYSDGTRKFYLEPDSLSLPKLTVSGLPSQLKFTDKTVVDSKTKAVIASANTIYCANESKLPAPGTYVVTVKATNVSVKKAIERKFTIVIDDLTAANGLLQGQGDESTRLKNSRFEKYTMSVGVAEYTLPRILALDGAKVSVTKLPAGLKYDAVSGDITGIATKAGTFTTYITIGKAVSTFTVEVKALPAFAVGTFNGGEYDAEEERCIGISSFTIDAKGKLSGKITEEGGAVWTIAAASFDSCDLEKGEYYVDLKATYVDKSVKPNVTYTRTFGTVVTCGESGGELSASRPKDDEDESELELEAYQDLWKTGYKADGEALFKDGTKKFRVYDHVEAAGLLEDQSLSLKIETTGKVTGTLTAAAGVFTATATLVTLSAPGVRPMSAEVYLVFAPNASKKFAGLAVHAQLEIPAP